MLRRLDKTADEGRRLAPFPALHLEILHEQLRGGLITEPVQQLKW